MKRKIVWLVVSCLMVTALVLASCAPAAVEEEEEVVTPGEEEVAPPEEEEVVTEEKEMVRDSLGKLVEKPQYGGEVTFTLAASIVGFDEAYNNPWDCITTQYTNEELMTGDWTKGPAGTGEIGGHVSGSLIMHLEVGCLAESWEMPDDETIIYHIRQGVHYHDKPPVNGREMVAEDVAYSLRRLYEIPSAYLYANYPPEERPTSITAPDKRTVVINCPAGKAGTILYGHSDYFSVIPPEVVEEYGDMRDWRVSSGTGPFMMIDHVQSSSTTLVRNPDYWQKDPLHPDNTLPYLDEVKMLVIEDYSTRLSALRTGKIDILGISWEDLEGLMSTTPELESATYLPGNSWNIFMRNDKPELPWYDKRVRHALALAIDNVAIVEEYYGGNAERLTTPLVPAKEFAEMNTALEKLPESTRQLYEYHPDKAKQLLAEAGYPDGFKAEILCLSAHADLLSIVTNYWQEIGVDLEIQVREYPVLVSRAFRRTHEQMIMFYFGNSNPNTFAELWSGNPQNLSIVDDENIMRWKDELLENFMDWDRLCQIQKEQIPYILEQCWLIQAPTAYSFTMWWPWVKKYHGESSIGRHNGGEHFMYLWVDTKLKKEMGY